MPRKGTRLSVWNPAVSGRLGAAPDRLPQSLAAAIILQAFRDAMTGWNDENLTAVSQAEAKLFLTANAGLWAESRRSYAAILGIPDEDLRSAADVVIYGPPEAREAIEKRISAKAGDGVWMAAHAVR